MFRVRGGEGGICPVDLEQDVCAFEVDGMSGLGDVGDVGSEIVGEVDVVVVVCERSEAREDVGSHIVVCVRYIGMRTRGDLNGCGVRGNYCKYWS